MAAWDKLLKGETQPDKVRAVLKYKDVVYTSTSIYVRASAEEKSFYANFITSDWTVRTSEKFKSYFGELRIYKFVDTSPNIDSTSVGIRTCDGELHSFNAEFID